MAEAERLIILKPAEFGDGYSVEISPPVNGEDLGGKFDTYRKARGWAGGLRFTRGWRLRDLTDEGARHPD